MAFQVSVVVPVYNGAPFAARCVACLKAQTLRDVEFIIVDDASTDSTVKDLEREIAGDARFKLLRQDVKRGPLSARMRGVALASAPAVMFMDFDDELVPDACRAVAETMERTGAQVFCYGMDATGEGDCDARALEKCRAYLARRSPFQGMNEGADKCADLFVGNAGLAASACDKAARTDLLRRVYSMVGNGDGLLCAQDFLQTTLLFLTAESVFVDQSRILYTYHYGAGMMGRRRGEVTWEQFMRRMTAIDTYHALCRILDGMEGVGDVLRETAKSKFLGNVRNKALPEVWKLPPGLIADGLEIISRKWGPEGRSLAEKRRPGRKPGLFARARRKIAGLIRRVFGKGEHP